MAESLVDRLAKTAPGLEIWLDSSPLVYKPWMDNMIDRAPQDRKAGLKEQLLHLFNPENVMDSLVKGVTTNPKLSLIAIQENMGYWENWVTNFHKENPALSVEQVFWILYKEIVRKGAEMLLPLYESSGYRYGFLSGQLDPRNLFNREKMLGQARELRELAPNIMVKVPGSYEGMDVLRQLTSQGIPTNATLCYTVPQYITVAKNIQEGLLEARANGIDLTQWRSVVTAMNARWESAEIFSEQAQKLGLDLTPEHKILASSMIFKQAYRLFRVRAYPSKMLICSVRTGPMVNGEKRIWHLEEAAGADAVFTLPISYFSELYTDFFDAPNIEFSAAIWKDIPQKYFDDLNKIPYFIQSFKEDGIRPEDFNTIPPLQNTYKEFSAATEEMVGFVKNLLSKPN